MHGSLGNQELSKPVSWSNDIRHDLFSAAVNIFISHSFRQSDIWDYKEQAAQENSNRSKLQTGIISCLLRKVERSYTHQWQSTRINTEPDLIKLLYIVPNEIHIGTHTTDDDGSVDKWEEDARAGAGLGLEEIDCIDKAIDIAQMADEEWQYAGVKVDVIASEL